MVLTLVTMLFATMLHAATNHLVDAVLALILMIGGVTGAQFGARAGQKIRGEHLRLLLGLSDSRGRNPLRDRTGDPPRRSLHHPRNRRRRHERARVARSGRPCAGAGRGARRGAGARGTADRLGLQPSRDGDAELFRRGAGAVRLGRKGRVHARRSAPATIWSSPSAARAPTW